ncbi:IS66 family insertion sequence element accessory protein TnpA [Flavitalea sp.]|nr:hypothetical protein [Flavitalea sp.]
MHTKTHKYARRRSEQDVRYHSEKIVVDVSSFCKENGIAKASYYYWLKKFRDQPQKSKKTGFVSVSVLPSAAIPLISVQLQGGTVINVFDRGAFSFIESIIG